MPREPRKEPRSASVLFDKPCGISHRHGDCPTKHCPQGVLSFIYNLLMFTRHLLVLCRDWNDDSTLPVATVQFKTLSIPVLDKLPPTENKCGVSPKSVIPRCQEVKLKEAPRLERFERPVSVFAVATGPSRITTSKRENSRKVTLTMHFQTH